jgi:tetratricopeptide (TPR) repeat protein
MTIAGDGTEVDWTVGYDPPAETFQATLQKMVDGVDTFKGLSAAYAKNPKDTATVFKLARKYGDRYDAKNAVAKYKEVLALDPQGKAGTYTQDDSKITAPYTEFAAFEVATQTEPGAKPDVAAVKAFVAKYPKSPLIKSAYENMGYYYGYQGTKEEAAAFFPEYIAKYPNDPSVLYTWLARINRDKGPVEKGVELAAKIEELTKINPNPSYNQALAQTYLLKGDKAKADKLYGKDFMEGKVSSLGYDLIAYATFWSQNGGDMDSAIKMGETALKLEPDSAYFLGQVAGLYAKAGQLPKALQIYGPAYSRKAAKDATALYQYAGFWARQEKNLDDALAAAKKALELTPTYFIYGTLSTVYDKMKNKAEAVKAAEKALELAPEGAMSYFKQNLDKLKNPASAPDKK